MHERWLLPLTAGFLPAFLAAVVAQAVAGRLIWTWAAHPIWLAYGLVAVWLTASLLLGVLLARSARPVLVWRCTLWSSALILVVGALWPWASGAPLSLPFLVVLAIGAAALMVLAVSIDESKVKRPKAKRTDLTRQQTAPPSSTVHLSARIRAGLFWLCALIFIEAFRQAHIVAQDPHRGAGMLGMLLAMFIILPAASFSAWFPRAALVLLTLGTASAGGIARLSGLQAWWLMTALTFASAVAFWWKGRAEQSSGAATPELVEDEV